MDALARLLDGARAHGAFLLCSRLDPPWSLRIEDEAPLTLVASLRGEAWLAFDGETVATHLGTGDVAIVCGPDHYWVADEPGRPADVVIHPGQLCTNARGEDVRLAMRQGVRSWGNSALGTTLLLTGTYEGRSEVSRRLLQALPRRLVLRREQWQSPLCDLLANEVAADAPGQELVLDRLLDLLVVTVVRGWLLRAEGGAPGWWRAGADAVVDRALRLMVDDPASPWTIATLADAVGLSRAALARRFAALVGEPPMTFLTGWRLALAADLLREPEQTLAGVAERVGYGSAFALSAAFKRAYGMSPARFRQRAAPA